MREEREEKVREEKVREERRREERRRGGEKVREEKVRGGEKAASREEITQRRVDSDCLCGYAAVKQTAHDTPNESPFLR